MRFCTKASHGTGGGGGGGCSTLSSSSEVDMTLPSLLPLSTDDDGELVKESCSGNRNKGGQVLELPGESGVVESKRGAAEDDAGDPNMNCIARLLADNTSSLACLNCRKGNPRVRKLKNHQIQEKETQR